MSGIIGVVQVVYNRNWWLLRDTNTEQFEHRGDMLVPRVGDHILIDWTEHGKELVLGEVNRIVLEETHDFEQGTDVRMPFWGACFIFIRVSDDVDLKKWNDRIKSWGRSMDQGNWDKYSKGRSVEMWIGDMVIELMVAESKQTT